MVQYKLYVVTYVCVCVCVRVRACVLHNIEMLVEQKKKKDGASHEYRVPRKLNQSEFQEFQFPCKNFC